MENKKTKAASMEEEDRLFWDAVMKNPTLKKKIEADMKKRDDLFRSATKSLLAKKSTNK